MIDCVSASGRSVIDSNSQIVKRDRTNVEGELSRFDPMQKGLYKQFSNSFRKHQSTIQQQDALDGLQRNLSGQAPGPMRAKQDAVPQLLAHSLGLSWTAIPLDAEKKKGKLRSKFAAMNKNSVAG